MPHRSADSLALQASCSSCTTTGTIIFTEHTIHDKSSCFSTALNAQSMTASTVTSLHCKICSFEAYHWCRSWAGGSQCTPSNVESMPSGITAYLIHAGTRSMAQPSQCFKRTLTLLLWGMAGVPSELSGSSVHHTPNSSFSSGVPSQSLNSPMSQASCECHNTELGVRANEECARSHRPQHKHIAYTKNSNHGVIWVAVCPRSCVVTGSGVSHLC